MAVVPEKLAAGSMRPHGQQHWLGPLTLRIAVLFAGTVVIATIATTALANNQLVGRASVVEGDTIEIHGERVRCTELPCLDIIAVSVKKALLWRTVELRTRSHIENLSCLGEIVRLAENSSRDRCSFRKLRFMQHFPPKNRYSVQAVN